MTADTDQLALAGFALPDQGPHEPGPVERGVTEQVEQLRRDGWITVHHAGTVALVLRAARDVDESAGKGAPSGRANLLRVMNEILAELPAPEAAQDGALEKALEALNGHKLEPLPEPFIPDHAAPPPPL